MSFLPPNQQRQSTEGNEREHIKAFKYVPYVKKVDCMIVSKGGFL